MSAETMLSVAAGLVAGGAHCLMGPDHLAAVLPLAARAPKSALRIGFSWGIGHAGGVLVLAGLFQLLKGTFDLEAASGYAELLVGFVLIGLGLWTLRTTKAVVVHSHGHEHGSSEHAHPHLHVGDKTVDAEDHAQVGRHRRHGHSALLFGSLHGIAGTSHVVGVLPSLMLEGWTAVAYLASFLLGSMVAMAAFGMFAGHAVARYPARLQSSLRLAGGFSVAVGCLWVWQFAA